MSNICTTTAPSDSLVKKRCRLSVLLDKLSYLTLYNYHQGRKVKSNHWGPKLNVTYIQDYLHISGQHCICYSLHGKPEGRNLFKSHECISLVTHIHTCGVYLLSVCEARQWREKEGGKSKKCENQGKEALERTLTNPQKRTRKKTCSFTTSGCLILEKTVDV